MSRSGPSSLSATLRLEPDALRWRCDASRLAFETTGDIEDCPIRIIGQPRALAALELGLALRSKGFNVFVSGEVGSGRSTVVGEMLDAAAATASGEARFVPDDLVYVHNFADPDRPRLQRFAAGRGKQFRAAMEELVENFQRNLPKLFESDGYRVRRTGLIERAAQEQKALMKEFEHEAATQGFTLAQIQLGPVVRSQLVPVVAGDPVDFDELDKRVEQGAMQPAELERLRSSQVSLQEQMELLGKRLRASDRDVRRALHELDREFARPLVQDAVGDIREEFGNRPIGPWLDAVTEDILEDLDAFRETGDDGDEVRVGPATERYQVNVVVDNAGADGRPVIWETAPNSRNLFGTIDKHRTESGDWETDHTRVKAGSILRANGGFLVLDALDLLTDASVWSALKRTLRHRKVELQSTDAFPFIGESLAPEAVSIDVKVVMIGTRQIFRLLHAVDEDFKKIFKIKAEFTTETPLSDDELHNYACLVQKRCVRDGLPPFHRDAVAAIAEEGARLAERQDKLTTRFSIIADLVREAGYWAGRESADVVRATHIDRAVSQQIYRVNLVEETLRERMAEGQVLIELEGLSVGQVNGLAVLAVADHAFALPSRITATVAVGRLGIIDVERDAEMSGNLHTKGVLILTGFLRRRFAQNRPLALTASLAFEQTYGGVDGDSASSTELYALLSALSGVPLRQGVAVTGSVNQRGEVQTIGGVNEKIEGFFDLCRLSGLTGEQGVMIPASNRVQLMLRKDVVAATAEGRFHVWAVSTIDEGLAVLSGEAPGACDADGTYPAGSLYARVEARIDELAEAGRRAGLLGRDSEA